MKEGSLSPIVQGWVNRLEHDLQRLHPDTPAQQAALLQLLEQQDKRTDARRARLTEANRALPAPVWFILGLGAFVTIGFAMFFVDRREHFIVQGALIGAITAAGRRGPAPDLVPRPSVPEPERQHQARRDGAPVGRHRSGAGQRPSALQRAGPSALNTSLRRPRPSKPPGCRSSATSALREEQKPSVPWRASIRASILSASESNSEQDGRA